MPVLAALAIILQVGLAIHCVKTGRDRQWLWFIITVPLIGAAVYFITQVLPDLQSDRAVQRAVGGLAKAVDPQRELRRRKDELDVSDSIDNRLRLADECMEASFFAEAEELYAGTLQGHHREDPNIHLKVAQAQFAQEKFKDTRRTLEHIVQVQPDYKSTDGHLLYARSLEALNDPGARDEYQALLDTYPGEEARVRFAQWLDRAGEQEKARELYRDVGVRARRAPEYYRRAEKHWIDIAARHAD